MYFVDRWPNESEITINVTNAKDRFLNDLEMNLLFFKDKVNIKFKITQSYEAMVRIELNDQKISRSLIGPTGILNVPVKEPNMVLDIVTEHSGTAQYIILHEFCHVLGCIHEHQRPDREFKFIIEETKNHFVNIKEFLTDRVYFDVIDTDTRNCIYKTPPDKFSIMNYIIPASCTEGGYTCNHNNYFSDSDIDALNTMYPL